eukprot:4705361-Pyramimonas_sp.AAC.1
MASWGPVGPLIGVSWALLGPSLGLTGHAKAKRQQLCMRPLEDFRSLGGYEGSQGAWNHLGAVLGPPGGM